MATLESLQAKIQRLQAQADALLAKKSSAVIAKIKNLMEEHGLTTADIDAHAGGKKSAKAGNYVRGPQPALYRDAKSAATWSGRGRAPAWIAQAKDRGRFLIDGVSAADRKPVVKNPVANKAVVKKGPTAKKTAVNKAAGAKVPTKNAAAKKAPR
ncbi:MULTISPECIES: H-NS histone family protein [Paraburkholderia]|uniref:H-NS family nucleoid-associated regulatory protein n=1 Tax=Paraburkholderia strydomiana TaxID=1245417 RepID=A0ABW9C369_9BURK